MDWRVGGSRHVGRIAEDAETGRWRALHRQRDSAREDAGACYFSLWNWHRIQADRILNYYHQFPDAIDGLARQIGYRVRPSWVWTYEEGGYPGLIIGFVNDGIAAVPGVLRVSVLSEDGKVNVGGSLDAGLPAARQGEAGEVRVAQGNELERASPEGGD